MKTKATFSPEELHYLRLLATQYPTVQAASTEIINLQAILNLPKGTEHFISDIHGEYEAFQHILNSCSGYIKEKLDELFGTTMSRHDRDELATLIYYPQEKLALVNQHETDMDEWYCITLHRLVELCRWVANIYTRSRVRKAITGGYETIIDELLQIRLEEPDKRSYYEDIISSIIDIVLPVINF
jgi:fructose-1,6-bisphosphatase-3